MSQCGTRRQALCRARRAPPAFAARRGLQAPHVVRRAGRRAPSGRARGARRSARLCGAAVGDAEHLLGQRQPPAALAHARARVPAPLPPAARGRALCRALHGLLPAQQAHALPHAPPRVQGRRQAAPCSLACLPRRPLMRGHLATTPLVSSNKAQRRQDAGALRAPHAFAAYSARCVRGAAHPSAGAPRSRSCRSRGSPRSRSRSRSCLRSRAGSSSAAPRTRSRPLPQRRALLVGRRRAR